jgi:hypothetical protein
MIFVSSEVSKESMRKCLSALFKVLAANDLKYTKKFIESFSLDDGTKDTMAKRNFVYIYLFLAFSMNNLGVKKRQYSQLEILHAIFAHAKKLNSVRHKVVKVDESMKKANARYR